jgi:hypothetical protein
MIIMMSSKGEPPKFGVAKITAVLDGEMFDQHAII